MEFDKICKNISQQFGEDYDTVHKIAMWQFYFTTEVMKHTTDVHDILFNKLFKFKLKTRFKLNKQNKYSPHESNKDDFKHKEDK